VSAQPPAKKKAGQIEKETVPFLRSFTRAPPLAKKTASLIEKRNFFGSIINCGMPI
jgi:hypothetical protein